MEIMKTKYKDVDGTDMTNIQHDCVNLLSELKRQRKNY